MLETEFFASCCGVMVESCNSFSLKNVMCNVLPPAESNFSEVINSLSVQRPKLSCFKLSLYDKKKKGQSGT